jgi:isochorismate synthase
VHVPDRLRSGQEYSTLEAADLLAVAGAGRSVLTFYWEKPSEGLAMLGLGTAWEMRASGSGRFAEVSHAAIAALHDGTFSGDRAFGPFAVGGFGFSDAECRDHAWREFPSLRWWIPELLWVRRGADCCLTRTRRSGASGGADDRLREALAVSTRRPLDAAPRRALRRLPTADEKRRWAARVEEVSKRIAANELDKVVLARRRTMRTRAPLDAAAMLAAARSRRPTCTSFCIHAGETSFFGSTPERLVALDGERFRSGALAGSAPRSRDRVEDDRLGAALLACAKNRREHDLVVEAVRAALGPVAASLEVADRPTLVRLPEAQHLSTPIYGRLAGDATVLELAARLHPTPAVCGVPREAARQVIEQQEPGRGWFTGAVGWMAPSGSGELAVALRSVLIDGRDATLWAGAGIVRGSSAETELAETEAKMTALFESLGADDDERAA